MGTKSALTLFSPAELRKLYQENPEKFDELADQAIKQACIARTQEKSIKLQQLQWTIDMQLRKAKTPVARMHAMENIFYSKIYGDDGQLAQLADSCNKLLHVMSGTGIDLKKDEVRKKRDLG